MGTDAEDLAELRKKKCAAIAAENFVEAEQLKKQIEALRALLLARRQERTYPLLDDKVITNAPAACASLVTAYEDIL